MTLPALNGASVARAGLIASFSFNNFPSSGSPPDPVNADTATAAGADGSNYIYATTFSSGFGVGPGTTSNKDPGNPNTKVDGQALVLDSKIPGNNRGNNGGSVTFRFSTSAYMTATDVPFTFAAKTSAVSGFTNNRVEYSKDNKSWGGFDRDFAPTSSAFTTAAFTLSNLIGYSNLYVKITFDGAGTNGGTETIDNLNLGETATPELNSSLLFGSAVSALLLLRRRRLVATV